VNLFSGIAGVALVVVNFVVAVVKHNTDDNGTSTGKLIFKDQDWLEEHSKDYRAAWYRYLQLWGNKKRGRLQKNWWLLVQYFIPAVAEEWLFRGFLQTLLSRYIGIGRAITIQAILFGLLHYGYKSKWHMTACAASGLWYGWLFEQTGNLPLVILMHFLKNSTTGFKCGQVVRCLLQYELRHLYELVAGPNEEQEGANEK
jgi:hypothetical protein